MQRRTSSRRRRKKVKKLLRPSWVEIDLDAVEFNARNIMKLAGNCEPIGVLKADAYGFGAVKISEILHNEGFRNFAVATLEEAIRLRESGRDDRVIVLGVIPDDNAEEAVQNDITVMITDYGNACAMNEAAVAQGKMVECFIALDTGMSRIGYDATDTETLVGEVRKISELSNLKIFGLHSHFAVSDEADKTFSYLQLDRFNKGYQALKDAGIEIPVRAIANSAAMIDLPETLEFEMCRPGFLIYGVYPSDDVHKENIDLKRPMTVKSRISYVKTIQPGDTVSYGRKFTATEPTRIATLPIGFADGMPRPYSPKGKAIVGGKLVNITGNICMDQCMIDVTGVDGVEIGTEVILMGSDGVNEITPEYITESVPGMVVDEVTGNFNKRMPKVYVRSSDPTYWEPAK